MRHLSSIVLIACAGLAAAACAPSTANWSPVEAQKTLKVDTGRRTLAIAFAPRHADLGAAQTAQLNGFIAAGGIQPADRITLLVAGPDRRLAARRRDRLAAALRRQGVGAVVDIASATDGAADRVTMLVEHAVVTLPDCPNWSKEPNDYTGAVASNFGCATTTDLGLMVADPQDLAGGRQVGPADGTVAAAAVHDYRTPPPGAGQSSAGSGGFQPGASGNMGNVQ